MTPPPSGGGIVTLLTDFGARDEYAGVMKGVILSLQPRAQVVDLCHEVPPGDIRKAGWLLEWSWRFFPAGTVHVVVVDPGWAHGGGSSAAPTGAISSSARITGS